LATIATENSLPSSLATVLAERRRREEQAAATMPTLQQIENDVKQLTKAEQEALRDWLENMLEDDLEFTDEFKAKIERGEQDLREGRIRVRKP